MKKKIAILLLVMIFVMSFTVVVYADDLTSWKTTGTENAELKSATGEITGLGLAVDYIVKNAFKMLLTIIVSWISIKLLFAKSGQSADASKQRIMFAVIAVLIYVLGVPILNMLGKSFSSLF